MPLSVLGTFTRVLEAVSPGPAFDKPFLDDPPFSHAYFSIAPLRHVEHIKVFNHKDSGYCVGILLRYNNGAERCVGQCRLGVDNVESIERINRLCLRTIEFDFDTNDPDEFDAVPRNQATLVSATCNADHHHSEPGWTCMPMRGELEFWFSCEETKLCVRVD